MIDWCEIVLMKPFVENIFTIHTDVISSEKLLFHRDLP